MTGNKFILGEGEKYVLEHYTRATSTATKHQESPILYKIRHHTGNTWISYRFRTVYFNWTQLN